MVYYREKLTFTFAYILSLSQKNRTEQRASNDDHTTKESSYVCRYILSETLLNLCIKSYAMSSGFG